MPASRIATFTDPQAYQAAIRAATVQVFPTTGGDFQAELVQINLHRLWLQRGRESLPRLADGAVNAGRVAFEFLLGSDQPPFRHSGIDLSPDEVVVNGWDATHRRTFAPC